MTVRELSQLHYLDGEIRQRRRRLERLERLLEEARAQAAFDEGERELAEQCAREMAEIRQGLEQSIQRRWQEMRRLLAYIEDIDDSLIRQILTCRYVDGKTWVKVAREIGGGNTEDSVKKAAYRYLQRGQARRAAEPRDSGKKA